MGRAYGGVLAVLLLAGCAGMDASGRDPELAARLDRLTQSEQRLEMRVDEVTRNLLALRERLDAQDARLRAQEEASRAPAAPSSGSDDDKAPLPPLAVVRVEPLPKEEPIPPAGGPPAAKAVEPAASAGPADAAATVAADLYRKAFNEFREARFGPAILDFEEFLRGHPTHEYADKAQYWLGESYYSQGEFKQALVEFHRVVEKYGSGPKAPDALLKIGYCYQKLGDQDKARVFWQRLLANYPQGDAAKTAAKALEEQGRRTP